MKRWLRYLVASSTWVNSPKKLFFASMVFTTLLTIILLIISFIDISVSTHAAVTLKAIRNMFFNAINCGVILLVSGLGWYGGYARHKCILATYEIIMVIPTFVELSNIRLLSKLDEEIDKATLIGDLDEAYKGYQIDSEVRKNIDTMHTYFQCCGSEEPKKFGDSYPDSCCKNREKDKCMEHFKLGCADAIVKDILVRLKTEGAFGVVLFVACVMVTCTTEHYRRLLDVLRN